MVKLNIPMPKECQECPCYNKADCRVLRLLHKPYYTPDIFSHKRYEGCPMEEIKDEDT